MDTLAKNKLFSRKFCHRRRR
jgi:hypothetical protein